MKAVCAAFLSLVALTVATAVASPVQMAYFPNRPKDSTGMKLIVGTVVDCKLTLNPLAEHLMVEDAATKRVMTFELGLNTNKR